MLMFIAGFVTATTILLFAGWCLTDDKTPPVFTIIKDGKQYRSDASELIYRVDNNNLIYVSKNGTPFQLIRCLWFHTWDINNSNCAYNQLYQQLPNEKVTELIKQYFPGRISKIEEA